MRIQEVLINKINQVAVASRMIYNHGTNHPAGQQRVLEVLHKEDGLIQSYLAEVLDLRPSSLAELVKKLEAKDEVKRVEDEQDKRIKRVFLTDKGRNHINRLLEGNGNSEDLFHGLNDQEIKQLNMLLDKMMNGWSDSLKQQTNRFMNPRDRMKHMEAFQQAVFERTGKDMNELSMKELREIRRDMFMQERGKRSRPARFKKRGE